MYGIGTVARLAQVSVRTLRHYDAIGLLRPARVDPVTGYRRYGPEQVHRLHRILVLRDLGVPLSEIGSLVDGDVTVEQLRGILHLRQAEVRAQMARSAQQLSRVERRLAQLEGDVMADLDVIVKGVAPLRVATLSEDLADEDGIAAACDRLYPRLHAVLARRGVATGGLSVALYDCTDDEDRPLRLTAALPVPDGLDLGVGDDGVVVVELPAVDRAATTVLRGAPEQFPLAFRALHQWVEQSGDQGTGHTREVYLDCDGPRGTWVTELQVVLEPQPASRS